MKAYIGITSNDKIKAKQIKRGAAYFEMKWCPQKDRDPDDDGYLIQYFDGYWSWLHKDIFLLMYKKEEK